MVYVTTRRRPSNHQMTLDEFLDPSYVWHPGSEDKTITYTQKYESLPWRLFNECPVGWYIDQLRGFNTAFASLRDVDRSTLYKTFWRPKKSGHGMRRIDAPVPELSSALTVLKNLLEGPFHGLNHTCAFAYTKGRCHVDAVRRHQANKSMWFASFDLHNFFGSTTLDFVMHQLAIVYPFSEVIKYKQGEEELRKALELGFLNGGLPQGTPLSPTLTNLMMVPVDFELSKTLRTKYPGKNFVYTRYADDFDISSRHTFSVDEIQNTILDVLRSFGAPFEPNKEKTHYGSRNGRNWMLGVMLNADNNITIGHKKKDNFRASLTNFANSYKSGTPWSKEEIQYVLGLYSYYLMVEEKAINGIVEYVNKKVGIDTIKTMKSMLNP